MRKKIFEKMKETRASEKAVLSIMPNKKQPMLPNYLNYL